MPHIIEAAFAKFAVVNPEQVSQLKDKAAYNQAMVDNRILLNTGKIAKMADGNKAAKANMALVNEIVAKGSPEIARKAADLAARIRLSQTIAAAAEKVNKAIYTANKAEAESHRRDANRLLAQLPADVARKVTACKGVMTLINA